MASSEESAAAATAADDDNSPDASTDEGGSAEESGETAKAQSDSAVNFPDGSSYKGVLLVQPSR